MDELMVALTRTWKEFGVRGRDEWLEMQHQGDATAAALRLDSTAAQLVQLDK
jgi:hypothetical protein